MGDRGAVMEAGMGEAPEGSRIFAEHGRGAKPEGGPGAVEVGGGHVQQRTAARRVQAAVKGSPPRALPHRGCYVPNDAICMFLGSHNGEESAKVCLTRTEKRTTPPSSLSSIGGGGAENHADTNPKT